MTLQERRDTIRARLPHPNKTDRLVVIPNDAPAYRSSGAWGVYDLDRCCWINFRESEIEALRLLATLTQAA